MTRIFIVILCASGIVWGETFVSTDVPVNIPDGPSGIAESQLPIPVNRRVLDVNVTLTITHPFVGDLRLYLEGPGENVVRLANRCGHSGDNYTNTTFDDEASTFICDASAPFTGSFTPDQALTLYDGTVSIGTWVLRVTDNAAGDVGSIQAWSLTMVLGDTITAAHDPFVLHPSSHTLAVYPNPFNPVTVLTFSLPQPQAATLVVYDMTGRVVERLADQIYPAGEQRVTFDGAPLPAGIYFARLDAGDVQRTQKMVLLK